MAPLLTGRLVSRGSSASISSLDSCSTINWQQGNNTESNYPIGRSKLDEAGRLTKWYPFFSRSIFRECRLKKLKNLSNLQEAPEIYDTHELGNQLRRLYWTTKMKQRISNSTQAGTRSANKHRVEFMDEKQKLLPDKANKHEASKKQKTTPIKSRLFWVLIGLHWQKFLLICILQAIALCLANPLQIVSFGWLIGTLDASDNLEDQFNKLTNITEQITQTATTFNHTSTNVLENQYQLARKHNIHLMVYYVLIMCASQWVYSVISHPYFLLAQHIGMKCRIATSMLIYQKTIKLNYNALNSAGSSKILNLVTNDANRFDDFLPIASNLIVGPIQAVIIMVILANNYIGLIPTMASFVVIILFLLIQFVLAKYLMRVRREKAKQTDSRLKLINELVKSIRIIRMYAWEYMFEKLIKQARQDELANLATSSYIRAFNLSLFHFGPRTIIFFSLICFNQLVGGELTAEVLYVMTCLWNIMRVSFIFILPQTIATLSELLISCKRIDEFLVLPETKTTQTTMTTDKLIHYQSKQADEGTLISKKHTPSISFHRVTASWLVNDVNGKSTFMKRFSVKLNKPSELVYLIGRTGSGKTSFIKTVLGELSVARGEVKVCGRLSYAPQDHWKLTGTIRENILLGKMLDLNRYQQVIEVCQLRVDMEQYFAPFGDLTLIDDNSSNRLSISQLSRINLARALYHQADIYLLDDPFSSLDALCESLIMEKAIRQFLADKLVILATNSFQSVDRLESPQIATTASYKIILLNDKHQPKVFERLDQFQKEFPVYAKLASARVIKPAMSAVASKGHSLNSKLTQKAQANNVDDDDINGSTDNPLRTTANVHLQSYQSGFDESNIGRTKSEHEFNKAYTSKWSDYFKIPRANSLRFYISTCGNKCKLTLLFVLVCFHPLLCQLTDHLLSDWTEVIRGKSTTWGLFDSMSNSKIAIIYALMILALLIEATSYNLLFTNCSMIASHNIHSRMLEVIVRIPLSFFDSTPMSNILSSFLTDLGYIDNMFPFRLLCVLHIFSYQLTTFLHIILINRVNLILGITLIVFLYGCHVYTGATMIRLKRLECQARARMILHMNQTLKGLGLIRAYGIERQLEHQFVRYQNAHTAAWFAFISAGQFSILLIDWIVLIHINLLIGLQVYIFASKLNASSPAEIGLMISLAILQPEAQQAGLRQLVDVRGQMASLENLRRLIGHNYLVNPEQARQTGNGQGVNVESKSVNRYQHYPADDDHLVEPDQDVRLDLLAKINSLTSQTTVVTGFKVKFSNVTLRYLGLQEEIEITKAKGTRKNQEPEMTFSNFSKLDQNVTTTGVALNGCSFVIQAGEKVAIIGKTGSGKTSLISALLNFYPYDGLIELADIDTKLFNLRMLRSSISILSRDPVLFNGTLRRNLDPFNERNDEEIWLALETVGLRNYFQNKQQQLVNDYTDISIDSSKGLETIIEDGAANFSLGQKQLICLTRALLRRNKLLIVDEATDCLDLETDELISDIIGKQFSSCTVIKITNCLMKLVDCQRVLIMVAGRVVDFDKPQKLIQNSKHFNKLIDDSGIEPEKIKSLLSDLNKLADDKQDNIQ